MALIMVLDDVSDQTVLVKRILERKGHEVRPFTDEEQALAFVRKNAVDLAILDMRLRRLSGIEVLSVLREIRPDCKVIMLTGYPTMETARQSLALGAVDYCVKPIDKAELEAKVEAALAAPAAP